MCFENYSDSSDALFSLIQEVKLGYQMTEEPPKRGRKPDFSDLSFLLLAVVAVETLDVFRLRTASSFAKGRAASGGFGFSQSPASDVAYAAAQIACFGCRKTNFSVRKADFK